MKKNKIVVVCGEHKFEVDVEQGQTITVWKLGDPKTGWIPNKRHFECFTNLLKKALEDPKKNHIVFHHFVAVEQVKV